MQMQLNQEEEDTQEGRYLTFGVAEEIYGIEIRYVTEIVGLQPITVIPEIPKHIKGIINLRGKIFPVIDMRIWFCRDASAYTDRTCIIVVNVQDVTIGLIVDQVEEVLSIDEGDIAPPPDQKTGIEKSYILGIGKTQDGIKVLLDCEKLLQYEGMNELPQKIRVNK